MPKTNIAALPWTCEENNEGWTIYGQGNEIVAYCDYSDDDTDTEFDAKQTAAFIARVCNAHAELVDCFQAQIAAAQLVIDCWSRGDLAGAVRSLDCLIEPGRAVLAKASEG